MKKEEMLEMLEALRLNIDALPWRLGGNLLLDEAISLARQLEEQKVVKFRVEDVGSDVESAWMGIVDEPKHLYFDLTIGARDTKQEVVEEIKLACEELGLRAEIEEG